MRCSPILIRCLRRNSDGANVPALGADVADKLRKKVGGQIEIINVIVPLVNTTRPPRTGSTR
jgi:hypothetical protein